jgi:hypothetical protein
MIQSPKNPAKPVGVDDTMADFWNGPLSRKEGQQVFDEIAATVQNLQGQAGAAVLTFQFLFAKLGVTKEEYEGFLKAQMEAKAKSASENTTGPDPVTVN